MSNYRKLPFAFFFICVFLAGVTDFTYGQISAIAREVDAIEIVAGPSLAYLRGDFWKDGEIMKIEYATGIRFHHSFFNTKLGISLSAFFERKGNNRKSTYFYEENGNMLSGQKSYKINFSYFTFPILLRYSYQLSQRQTIFFEVGPYGSFLLKNTFISEDKKRPFFQKVERTGFYKKWDFGASIGLGLRHEMKDGLDFTLELMSHYGLKQMQREFVVDSYNLSFPFMIGLAKKIRQ